MASSQVLFITNYLTPSQVQLFSDPRITVVTWEQPDDRRTWDNHSVSQAACLNYVPAARMSTVRKMIGAHDGVLLGGNIFTARIAECVRTCRARRIPYAFWAERTSPRHLASKARFLRCLLGRHGRMLAIGSRAQEHYRTLGVGLDKLFVFPYTYNASAREIWPGPGLGVPDLTGPLRVAMSSSVHDVKGLDVLLQALHALAEEGYPSQLSVLSRRNMGRTPPGVEVRRLELPPSAVGSFLAKHNVLVAPSRFDGWCLAVEEGMRVGIPVVASDAVGAVDWLAVDEVSALVVRAGCPVSLAQALRRLCNSEALRVSLAQGATERLAWHDARANVAELLRILVPVADN